MDFPVQEFAPLDVAAETIGEGVKPLDRSAILAEKTALAQLAGIYSEVGRIWQKGRMLFQRVREGTGLTGSEAQTLVAIVRRSEPPTVPQICRHLGSPRQVVQRAIKVLEREGFIEPLPKPDHKRAPLLIVTDEGRRTVERIDSVGREILDELAQGLAVEALGPVFSGLTALREQIDHTLGIEES